MARPPVVFAEELRRHCASRGSIAQVCLGTGINRQQFNKYLSGQILPNARNMRRICDFLGVTEAQLIHGADAPPSSAPSPAGGAIDSLPVPRQSSSRPSLSDERSANVLPVGYYDCYFPLHAASEMVVRWLISIRMRGGMLTFTCRSNVRTMGSGDALVTLAKYRGLVFAGPREAHLVATNDIQLHQPSIISVNAIPVIGRTYFSALATTRRIDGPLAIIAALRYRGQLIKVRKALDDVGIVSLRDPELDPVIVQLMRARPAAGANWMQSVNGKSLRMVSPSEGSDLRQVSSPRRLAR